MNLDGFQSFGLQEDLVGCSTALTQRHQHLALKGFCEELTLCLIKAGRLST